MFADFVSSMFFPLILIESHSSNLDHRKPERIVCSSPQTTEEERAVLSMREAEKVLVNVKQVVRVRCLCSI
jgi:hypothetical protein